MMNEKFENSVVVYSIKLLLTPLFFVFLLIAGIFFAVHLDGFDKNEMIKRGDKVTATNVFIEREAYTEQNSGPTSYSFYLVYEYVDDNGIVYRDRSGYTHTKYSELERRLGTTVAIFINGKGGSVLASEKTDNSAFITSIILFSVSAASAVFLFLARRVELNHSGLVIFGLVAGVVFTALMFGFYISNQKYLNVKSYDIAVEAEITQIRVEHFQYIRYIEIIDEWNYYQIYYEYTDEAGNHYQEFCGVYSLLQAAEDRLGDKINIYIDGNGNSYVIDYEFTKSGNVGFLIAGSLLAFLSAVQVAVIIKNAINERRLKSKEQNSNENNKNMN